MFGFGHFGVGPGFGFGFFGVSPFLIFFIVMMIVSALRRGRWGGGYRGGGRNYPRQGPPYDVRPYQRGQYDPNNPGNPNNPYGPTAQGGYGYPGYPTGQENEGSQQAGQAGADNSQPGYSNEPTYGYPVVPPNPVSPDNYSGHSYSTDQIAGAGTTRVDNLPTAGGEPTRPVPYDDLPDEVKARIPRPSDGEIRL